ncbi:MAG: hypothetical protein FJ104_13800, partial [Deltaproteobacteria bacterium]|nr:hypothetical protein [Deltaproteobacteria bacterium]
RSGVYFDPIGATGSYLRALPERASMLWLAQLGGPWSEGWNAYPVMFPGLELWVAGLAVVVLGIWAVAFRPLLRDDPQMRFWLGGALLATLPACSAFPADRLLPWIAVGASAATAQVFLLAVEHRGRLARLLAHGVVGAHLVVGPLLLPVRAAGITQVRASIERADRGLPRDPSVAGVDVVLVNPPADPFASYLPITRAALGVPLPASQRWLLTGARPVDVERVDDHALRLRANGGLFLLPSERLLRDPRTRPFVVGQRVETAGLTLEIAEVTPAGAPEVVVARFARPLDDPRTRFFRWEGDGFVPLEPLSPGETRRLPAADLVAVAYGKDSAVTQRFGASTGPSPGAP